MNKFDILFLVFLFIFKLLSFYLSTLCVYPMRFCSLMNNVALFFNSLFFNAVVIQSGPFFARLILCLMHIVSNCLISYFVIVLFDKHNMKNLKTKNDTIIVNLTKRERRFILQRERQRWKRGTLKTW